LVGVGYTVDYRSQRQLDKAITAMVAATRRSVRTVTRNAAVDIAYAGQRFTDLSRQYEDERAPVPTRIQNRKGRKGKSAKYVWAWIPQNKTGKMKRLPVKLKTAREHGMVWRAGAWRPTKWSGTNRKVESRGAHKAGWSGVLSQLGRARVRQVPGRAPWSRTTSATQYAKVETSQSKAKAGITEKLDFPGIYYQDTRKRMAQRAVAFVTARMLNSLQKMGVNIIRAAEVRTARPA
jgi:hypothetical protein